MSSSDDHVLRNTAGAALVTVAIAAATLPSLDAVSPCYDHKGVTTCRAVATELSDKPENDQPLPPHTQRAPTVAASSTVAQLSGRSMAAAMGRAVLTLSSV